MFGDFVEEIKDFMAHLAIGSEGEDNQLSARESFNGFPIFVIFWYSVFYEPGQDKQTNFSTVHVRT